MRIFSTVFFLIACAVATQSVAAENPAKSDNEEVVAQYLAARARLLKLQKSNPALVKRLMATKSASDPVKAAPANTKSASATPSPAADVKPKTPPSFTFLSHDATSFGPCGGIVLALRRDLDDLGAEGGCPKELEEAKGALVSFTDDFQGRNRIWNGQGLVATLYNYEKSTLNQTYDLYSVGFGPYASINTLNNSATALVKTNNKVISFGGLANLAVAPPLGMGLYSNFLISVAGVSNELTNVTSYDVRAQYVPALSALFIHKPIRLSDEIPQSIRFDPSIIAQYDGTDSTTPLAFANKHSSFRVGPQLTVSLFPDKSFDPDSPFIALSRLSASVTYHYMYDAESGKSLYLWSDNLAYALDSDQHFSLTGTYSRGRDETTGTPINKVLVGVAGKL